MICSLVLIYFLTFLLQIVFFYHDSTIEALSFTDLMILYNRIVEMNTLRDGMCSTVAFTVVFS